MRNHVPLAACRNANAIYDSVHRLLSIVLRLSRTLIHLERCGFCIIPGKAFYCRARVVAPTNNTGPCHPATQHHGFVALRPQGRALAGRGGERPYAVRGGAVDALGRAGEGGAGSAV